MVDWLEQARGAYPASVPTACLPSSNVLVQEFRELLHALRTIAFVCSFGPERLRCSKSQTSTTYVDTGNYHHVYDAGYP